MNREGIFLLILGTQNTGKSTFTKRLMAKAKRALILLANRMDSNWEDIQELNWEDVLMNSTGLMRFEISKLSSDKFLHDKIRFFHALGTALNEFEGQRKIFIQSDEERVIFEAIADKEFGFRNGTLVCDDFKNYIPSNNLPGYVRNLITDRRFKMLDLFFVTHGPRLVPPDFFTYNPGIVLHGTTENFDMAEHKVDTGAYARLRDAKARVDAKFHSGGENRFYNEYIKIFGGSNG